MNRLDAASYSAAAWDGAAAEDDASEGDPYEDATHHGQLIDRGYDDDDYITLYGARIRKAQPAIPDACECTFPLPIRWQWDSGECEFGDPVWCCAPGMESVIADDPLIYRARPWLWFFCHCNACLSRNRERGRPPKYCTRCQRDKDNAARRRAYALKKVIKSLSESVEKEPIFVA